MFTFIITDGDARQIDLDPMMLTILGVVAGVLIVIIIVTLAIRIHASRSRGRLRTRAASEVGNGNPSGNKVVVTTIEGNYSLYAKKSKNAKTKFCGNTEILMKFEIIRFYEFFSIFHFI